MVLPILNAAINRLLPEHVQCECAFVAAGSQVRRGRAAPAPTPQMRQHQAGRDAARRALSRLGIPEGSPLARAPGGAPVWPPGAVGSISHTNTVAVAVSAWASEVKTLGIDIEAAAHLDREVLEIISSPNQLSHIDDLRRTAEPSQPFHLIVFSAKEAAYKALSPDRDAPLPVQEIDIHVQPQGFTYGSFQAMPGHSGQLEGRYVLIAGHLITVCWRN